MNHTLAIGMFSLSLILKFCFNQTHKIYSRTNKLLKILSPIKRTYNKKTMIETQRLYIKPLKVDELISYYKSPEEFAATLGLSSASSLLDEEVQEAMLNSFLPNLKNPDKDYLFYTLWVMIEKHHKSIIGGICFHGEPSVEGEVEIGYGTDYEFQNKGYMTETIAGIINWAQKNDKISTIIAETAISNNSSLMVLGKNNFKKHKTIGDNIIMRYNLKNSK